LPLYVSQLGQDGHLGHSLVPHDAHRSMLWAQIWFSIGIPNKSISMGIVDTGKVATYIYHCLPAPV